MAILIAGSQNACKFNNLILQVSYGTPLKWVLSRIHYTYDDNYEETHITEVIIAKHRHGETGRVDLYFHPELLRFMSLDKTREE